MSDPAGTRHYVHQEFDSTHRQKDVAKSEPEGSTTGYVFQRAASRTDVAREVVYKHDSATESEMERMKSAKRKLAPFDLGLPYSALQKEPGSYQSGSYQSSYQSGSYQSSYQSDSYEPRKKYAKWSESSEYAEAAGVSAYDIEMQTAIEVTYSECLKKLSEGNIRGADQLVSQLSTDYPTYTNMYMKHHASAGFQDICNGLRDIDRGLKYISSEHSYDVAGRVAWKELPEGGHASDSGSVHLEEAVVFVQAILLNKSVKPDDIEWHKELLTQARKHLSWIQKSRMLPLSAHYLWLDCMSELCRQEIAIGHRQASEEEYAVFERTKACIEKKEQCDDSQQARKELTEAKQTIKNLEKRAIDAERKLDLLRKAHESLKTEYTGNLNDAQKTITKLQNSSEAKEKRDQRIINELKKSGRMGQDDLEKLKKEHDSYLETLRNQHAVKLEEQKKHLKSEEYKACKNIRDECQNIINRLAAGKTNEGLLSTQQKIKNLEDKYSQLLFKNKELTEQLRTKDGELYAIKMYHRNKDLANEKSEISKKESTIKQLEEEKTQLRQQLLELQLTNKQLIAQLAEAHKNVEFLTKKYQPSSDAGSNTPSVMPAPSVPLVSARYLTYSPAAPLYTGAGPSMGTYVSYSQTSAPAPAPSLSSSYGMPYQYYGATYPYSYPYPPATRGYR